jgi:poly-gamma-glutamate synthesis protein (capsule biosynthesis protein)
MVHQPVVKSALGADGLYDFRPHYQYVRPFFKNADLVVGNLETPLAGGRYSGYPLFNAPDDLADALKWAGFSALNLANNHSLDRGWAGLARTVEVLKERGLIYMGAFTGPADRAAPRLFSAAGVTVGLSGYTYGVNVPLNYPNEETWRLNLADEKIIEADQSALKEAGADYTVVNLHFGEEYRRTPTAGQINLVENLFAAGVDLIIGHHPHVVEPARLRPGTGGGQAAVFSLGNFISNQRFPYTNQGLMLEVSLGFDPAGRKIMGPLILHQTRCLRRVVAGRPTYRVLPTYAALRNPGAYGLAPGETALLAADQLALSRHLLNY